MDDAKKQTKKTGGNQPATREVLLRVGRYSSIPDILLADEALTPAAKLVWIALVSHLREDAVSAWPSIARLARLTGTSSRTAIRAVADLEARGLVEIERESGRSSVYSMFQPAAGNWPGKPTSAKMSPVPKCHRTSAKMSPLPVTNCHPKHLSKHSKNNSPLTPRVAGGGCAGVLPANAVDKKAAEKLKSAQMQRSSTAGEAVERIDVAYRAVFGPQTGLPSQARRKVRRGWDSDDRWWLSLIDAEAIRGGRKKAEAKKASGQPATFGLGWVRAHIEETVAAEADRAAAKTARTTAAEKAANGAAEEVARQADEARAHAKYFAALSDERREVFREKIRNGRFAPKRIDVVETLAALAAWLERIDGGRAR